MTPDNNAMRALKWINQVEDEYRDAGVADAFIHITTAIRIALQRSAQPDPRISEFFNETCIGCGDDPIGFLIASHRLMAQQRNDAKAQVDGLVKGLSDVAYLLANGARSDDIHGVIKKHTQQFSGKGV